MEHLSLSAFKMVEKNYSKKNPKIPLLFSQYGEDDVSIFFC